jgi:hypothetical protein
MFANLTKLGQSAASKAAKLAEAATSQVDNGRIQKEYTIGAEIGSAGTGGIWRIHRAQPKRGAHAGAEHGVTGWHNTQQSAQFTFVHESNLALSAVLLHSRIFLQLPCMLSLLMPLAAQHAMQASCGSAPGMHGTANHM